MPVLEVDGKLVRLTLSMIDRTMSALVRQILIRDGRYPERFDDPTYTNNLLEQERVRLRNEGSLVDVYVGGSDLDTSKASATYPFVPYIRITRRAVEPGRIASARGIRGSGVVGYRRIDGGSNQYDLYDIPERTSNIQYEVRTCARTTLQATYLDSVVLSAYGDNNIFSAYVPITLGDNDGRYAFSRDDYIHLIKNSAVDISDGAFIQYLYDFRVLDASVRDTAITQEEVFAGIRTTRRQVRAT